MKLNREQFEAIVRELADIKASQAALVAQTAELHGRITEILESNDEINKRLSFERRPRP